MSNVATRLLVDLKRERRMRAEVAAFDKELKEAVANTEKEKEEKLKKKKPQMDQMRLKASTGRFKVVLVTWLPFIAVYYLMGELRERLQVPQHLRLGRRRVLADTHPLHRDQREHGADLVVLPLLTLVRHVDDKAAGNLPDLM